MVCGKVSYMRTFQRRDPGMMLSPYWIDPCGVDLTRWLVVGAQTLLELLWSRTCLLQKVALMSGRALSHFFSLVT